MSNFETRMSLIALRFWTGRKWALAAMVALAMCGPAGVPPALGQPSATQAPASSAQLVAYTNDQLLDEVEKRAVLCFRETSDPVTGLTLDRAKLDGGDENGTASTASTGYALASLPIAAERHWEKKKVARATAIRTLKFLLTMPREHGFFYHWVKPATGERTWNSEVSTIDTGLLVSGALVCGEYFGGEARQLAQQLYDGVDWTWALTNGGAKPDKLRLTGGWKPETGFTKFDYGYCEAQIIYLLAMGSAKHPAPNSIWPAFGRPLAKYGGYTTLGGGPLFLNQMPEGFFDLRGQRDALGFDYFVAGRNATEMDRLSSETNMRGSPGYNPLFWGRTACDGPDGYQVDGFPDHAQSGTFGPCAVLASVIYDPETCLDSIQASYHTYGTRLWGRYGFADGYNPARDWCDPDVITIDLGMAMLAIENNRSGLVWRLMAQNPATARALAAAGFHATVEVDPRPLQWTSAFAKG